MFESSLDFHAKKRSGFISPELRVCSELTEGSLAWRLLYLSAAKALGVFLLLFVIAMVILLSRHDFIHPTVIV